MNEQVEPIRVAIACQGGGSHTAFTAGVLGRLLQPDVMADHKIVALSGTSGGAICALLAWSALVDGEPEKAESLLHGFWSDNSASTLPERMLNWWVLWAGQMANYVATPAVSPYVNPAVGTGARSPAVVAGTVGRLRPPQPVGHRFCGAGAAVAGAGCGGRDVRGVQGLRQPPRGDHRRRCAGLRGDPDPVSFGARRRRPVLGWVVLPESTGTGSVGRPSG